MAEDPLTTKISKARDSVGRLCEFFAARRTWALADDARSGAEELVAVARAAEARLETLILRAGAVPLAPAVTDVEARADGVLDAPRIRRFAAYLLELDSWFAAQPGPPTEPSAVNEVQRTQALLARTIGLVDELLLSPVEPVEPDADTPDRTPGPAPEPIPDPLAEPASPAFEAPTDQPRQLVLDDSDEHPLVQEFRNIKELTPGCKELVGGFLRAWGIEHNSLQHKKFLDRLLRWMTSAPEGQVLVLKVNTLNEPIEPYPAYVARDILKKADDTPPS